MNVPAASASSSEQAPSGTALVQGWRRDTGGPYGTFKVSLAQKPMFMNNPIDQDATYPRPYIDFVVRYANPTASTEIFADVSFFAATGGGTYLVAPGNQDTLTPAEPDSFAAGPPNPFGPPTQDEIDAWWESVRLGPPDLYKLPANLFVFRAIPSYKYDESVAQGGVGAAGSAPATLSPGQSFDAEFVLASPSGDAGSYSPWRPTALSNVQVWVGYYPKRIF